MAFSYRDLRPYKYQLLEDYEHVCEGAWARSEFDGSFLSLSREAKGFRIVVKRGYAWDGASGPAIDTPTIMRASLVHDALYQLMRLRIIPQAFRQRADEVLREISIEDGMSVIRATYVYWAVRLFASGAAK